MKEERAARLAEKYSKKRADAPKKEFSPGPRRGPAGAMRQASKPKNIKGSVVRMIRYLSEEKWLMTAAVTLSLIFTFSSLAASYMLRPIINRFIYFDPSSGDVGERIRGLFLGLCVLAAVYGAALLSQWLQNRLMLTVSQRALFRMRKELFSKLQTLPIKYFDQNSAGDIMSRFTNDVDTIGEMLNTTLIQIISGAINLIGTVFLMLYTNLVLGGITIVMAPVLAWAGKTIARMGRAAYAEQQRSLGMINGYAEETISGQKVVKVFDHEELAMEEFGYLNSRLCRAQIKAQFRAGIMGPVTHQLCNVTYALTACIGGIMVAKNVFDIGGLTVSLNYTRQFNRPINEITMQMNTVFSALAGAERVFEVLDTPPEEDKEGVYLPEERIRGEVVMKNVYFGYTEGVPVLKDISLTAMPGQKIAFVGSTGAGKTTVTNLLSRFYDLQKGSITIDGHDIEKLPRSYVRQNIAMVLQDTHLFSGTVMENIRYGRPDATDEDVINAAKASSAHSFITHLENGYETVLSNDGANLSQGQRQLITIARAAVSYAPILILDEATSSVDTKTEKDIEKGMDALMENRTTFVIAHRLSTVRKSNAIMVLEHGEIIERGTHEELIEAGGRYADLYNEKTELD